MSRGIFRSVPFCKLPHFLRLLPPLEREILYLWLSNIYNAQFSDSEALRPNYSAHAAAIVQSKSFAYVGPSVWTIPALGITIPVTYPAAEMT